MMRAANSLSILAASAALLPFGSAAWADLTAEQVWQAWRGFSEVSGYEFDATETRSGNALNVSDIKMRVSVPDAGSVTFTMPSMVFTENGDGTVSVEMPDVFPIGMEVDAEEEGDLAVSATVSAADMTLLASGEPGNVVYRTTAPMIAMAVDSITTDGQKIDFSQLGSFGFRVLDVAGVSTATTDDAVTVAQEMTTGAVDLLLKLDVPGEDAKFNFNYAAENSAYTGTYVAPIGSDPDDTAQVLRDGARVEANVTVTGVSGNTDTLADGQSFQSSSATEAGTLGFRVDSDAMFYSMEGWNTDVTAVGSGLPFPVAVSIGQTGFEIALPPLQDEDPQDFSISYSLKDLTISDQIWSLFDPSGQLPRDPATIALGLNGTAKLDTDLIDLDEDEIQEISEDKQFPGQVLSLALNELVIKAAGVALTGGGAFTFDNDDLETFGGFPAPDGAIDLKLTGVDDLLNTLTEMGLLPAQQASVARLVMGLYTVPDPEEGSLTSRIEVNPDGQVLANGQRIR